MLNVLRNPELVLANVPVAGQYIPIKKVLKKFFELPGVFLAANNFMEEFESSGFKTLHHVIQGELWKKVEKKIR